MKSSHAQSTFLKEKIKKRPLLYFSALKRQRNSDGGFSDRRQKSFIFEAIFETEICSAKIYYFCFEAQSLDIVT